MLFMVNMVISRPRNWDTVTAIDILPYIYGYSYIAYILIQEDTVIKC